MKFRARLMAIILGFGMLLLPLVASSHSTATPSPEPTLSSEQAIERAETWLSAQFVDGEYLVGFDGSTPDPVVTADGAIALYAGGGHLQTAVKSTAWVAEQAETFVTDPVTAARAAILADVAGQDPTDFGGVDLVEALGGELGDNATNPYGLGLVIIAMTRLEIEVPQATVDALLAAQEEPGSFGFPDYGTDIDATAMAAQALLALDENPDALAAGNKAVDWLIANQCTETSELCTTVGPYWGSYSPANTAGLAIGALADAGKPTDEQVGWLLGFQSPDGGFPAAAGVPQSDAYATAQAMLGLNQSSLVTVTDYLGSDSSGGNAPSTDPATGGETGDDQGGFSTPLIIGIAVAAGVLGGVIAFLRRRRQA